MASATWKPATEELKSWGFQLHLQVSQQSPPQALVGTGRGAEGTGTPPRIWQPDPSLTETSKSFMFWNFP